MDRMKDDFYYLSKIAEDMQFIIKHTKDITKEDLSKEEVLCGSIMFRLIQISETTLRLSEKCKNDNKEIPWMAIKGLRNKIVHDYGNVDYSVIYETIKNDIPSCLGMINKIIN